MTTREGFRINLERVAQRPMVDAHIAGVFKAHSRAECVAKLARANTAYGFVNNVAGLSAHKALRRVTVETEKGPVALAAPAARFSDGPRQYGPVPGLGEHSAAIRTEFGG